MCRAPRLVLIAQLALLIALINPIVVRAAVVADGDVTPADNIFTPGNQGLPSNGNFLDVNRVIIDFNTGAITQYLPQFTWEGILQFDANFDVIGNQNADVEVGASSSGLLRINSGSELRLSNLIIGGDFDFIGEGDELPPAGFGTVEVTGPGSLFNNDYTIIPPEVPQDLLNDVPNISLNPRSAEADAADGFDLRMGVTSGSDGTLSITAGGRVEIHDSIVIGDAAASAAQVTVDGFASVMQGGGCDTCGAGMTEEDPHILVVGRLGTGILDITNGGRVISEALTESATQDLLGAAIGGDPISSAMSAEEPDGGGTGIVNVIGSGSRWNIGAGLQIGGFSDSDNAAGGGDDIEGNDVRYGANVGNGTLRVKDGGLVSIANVVDEGGTGLETRLLIGRLGRIELEADGRVNLGSAGSQTEPIDENVILINDGVIAGDGRIDAGIFRNRHLGEVRVGENEKMLIVSTANLSGVPIPIMDLENFPLLNYGLVEVHGGEIEFERGEDDPDTDPPTFQAFQNRALDASDTAQLISRRVGEIEAKDAVLRFGTGISNQGFMNFIGGTNDVHGDVTNNGLVVGMFGEGVITITGDDTFVNFNGILTNNGTIDVSPDAIGFAAGDFVQGAMGTLKLVLGGGESGGEFSHIAADDNIILNGGTLQVDLNMSGTNPITPTAFDEFQIMSAAADLTGDFNNFILPFLGPTLGWFPFADTLADTYSLFVLSTAFSVGGDLNGDGIVDATDILIWQANAGNPGGLGDINMDGVVDAADLLIIQMQFGGPGMGAGAGSGTGATIPEPASGILAMMAMVSLGLCRRR